MSTLNTMQRKETISMLTTAAENGVTGMALMAVGDRYVWNAYGVRCTGGGTEMAGMCYEAEKAAGTLADTMAKPLPQGV